MVLGNAAICKTQSERALCYNSTVSSRIKNLLTAVELISADAMR